jgi:hypothetical protein
VLAPGIAETPVLRVCVAVISFSKRNPLIGRGQANLLKVLTPNVGHLIRGGRSGFSSALAPERTTVVSFQELDPPY